MWLWRHRALIMGWAGFSARATRRLAAGETDDVMAEGRLRAALTADPRTREASGLDVEVRDGVATLAGVVPAEAHEAAVAVAERQKAVRKVKDRLSDETRRGRRRSA
jgi:osmotically-inducible protein OsmY